MQIPSFSTDLIIIAVILVVLVYGMIAGQVSLIRETISIYVGIVLASTFGEPLLEFSKSTGGENLPINLMMVKLTLLILPVLILQFAHHKAHGREHASIIITMVLAVLAGMLFVSSIIDQLDGPLFDQVMSESNLAAQIYNLKLAWLGLVPVAIAASAIFKPKQKH